MNDYVNACKDKDSTIANLKEEKLELSKQIGVTK